MASSPETHSRENYIYVLYAFYVEVVGSFLNNKKHNTLHGTNNITINYDVRSEQEHRVKRF
jgi:hypothetical protein